MKLLLLISLLSVFTLLSCNDATTNPEAEYPIMPFKTDVIRPLSVGNYWTVNFVIKDSVIGNAKSTIIDSTNKIYNGDEVIVFISETEFSSSDSTKSYDYHFVFDNRTYHTCDISNNEITECYECIPYRYIGEAIKEFTEEESEFDGKTVTRLKTISSDSNYTAYYVIGIGQIETKAPVLVTETNERTIMTTKLVDYHVNR